MKHLDSDLIVALALGQKPMPAEAAHLGRCVDCSAELAELTALGGSLKVALPMPPRPLRQKTLRRLGLAPRERRGMASWVSLSTLGAGLALLVMMPYLRPRPQSPGEVPPAQPAGPTHTVALSGPGPTVKARTRSGMEAPDTRELVALAQAGTNASILAMAQTSKVTMGVSPVGGATSASAPALGKAVGGPVQVEHQGLAAEAGDLKAAPTPPASGFALVSVRNNLLKPAQGERFSMGLTLAGSGPVKAIVVDARGQTLATLFDAVAGPSPLVLEWDGGGAPSGVYTVLVFGQGASLRQKIILVR